MTTCIRDLWRFSLVDTGFIEDSFCRIDIISPTISIPFDT